MHKAPAATAKCPHNARRAEQPTGLTDAQSGAGPQSAPNAKARVAGMSTHTKKESSSADSMHANNTHNTHHPSDKRNVTRNCCGDTGGARATGSGDNASSSFPKASSEPQSWVRCSTSALVHRESVRAKHTTDTTSIRSRADDWVYAVLSHRSTDTTATNCATDEEGVKRMRHAYRVYLPSDCRTNRHKSDEDKENPQSNVRVSARSPCRSQGGMGDTRPGAHPDRNNSSCSEEGSECILFLASPHGMTSDVLQMWQRIARSPTAREACVQAVMGCVGPSLVGWANQTPMMWIHSMHDDDNTNNDDNAVPCALSKCATTAAHAPTGARCSLMTPAALRRLTSHAAHESSRSGSISSKPSKDGSCIGSLTAQAHARNAVHAAERIGNMHISTHSACAGATSEDGDTLHTCLWRGIANLHNTCYLNVVMQLLFSVAPVRQAILAAEKATLEAHDSSNSGDDDDSHSDNSVKRACEAVRLAAAGAQTMPGAATHANCINDGGASSNGHAAVLDGGVNGQRRIDAESRPPPPHRQQHDRVCESECSSDNESHGCDRLNVTCAAVAASPAASARRGTAAMMNLTTQTIVSCGIAELFAEMAYSAVLSGADASRFARRVGMDVTVQEDAHECLLLLFDWLRHHCGAFLSTTIDRTFSWKLLYDRRCSGCGRSVKRTELFYTLSLPAKATLSEAVECFLEPEEVQDAMCEGCGQSCVMVSRQYLRTLPSVLLIHVHHMPLEASATTRNSKSPTPMRIPFRLDMTPYVRVWQEERSSHQTNRNYDMPNDRDRGNGGEETAKYTHARAARDAGEGDVAGTGQHRPSAAQAVSSNASTTTTAATPTMKHHYELRGVMHHHGSSSRCGHYTYTGKIDVPHEHEPSSCLPTRAEVKNVCGAQTTAHTHADPVVSTRAPTIAGTTVWVHFNDAVVSEAEFMTTPSSYTSSMLSINHGGGSIGNNDTGAGAGGNRITSSYSKHISSMTSVTLPGVYLLVYHRVTSASSQATTTSTTCTTNSNSNNIAKNGRNNGDKRETHCSTTSSAPPGLPEFSSRLIEHVSQINAKAVCRRWLWLRQRDGLRALLREWSAIADAILRDRCGDTESNDGTPRGRVLVKNGELLPSPSAAPSDSMQVRSVQSYSAAAAAVVTHAGKAKQRSDEQEGIYGIPTVWLTALARCFLPSCVRLSRLAETDSHERDDKHEARDKQDEDAWDDEYAEDGAFSPNGWRRATEHDSVTSHTDESANRALRVGPIGDAAFGGTQKSETTDPLDGSTPTGSCSSIHCTMVPPYYASTTTAASATTSTTPTDYDDVHVSTTMTAVAESVRRHLSMPLPTSLQCRHGKLAPWAPYKILSESAVNRLGVFMARLLAWATGTADDMAGNDDARAWTALRPAALVNLNEPGAMCSSCVRALATRLHEDMRAWPKDAAAIAGVQPVSSPMTHVAETPAQDEHQGRPSAQEAATSDAAATLVVRRDVESSAHDSMAACDSMNERVYVAEFVVSLWQLLLRHRAFGQSVPEMWSEVVGYTGITAARYARACESAGRGDAVSHHSHCAREDATRVGSHCVQVGANTDTMTESDIPRYARDDRHQPASLTGRGMHDGGLGEDTACAHTTNHSNGTSSRSGPDEDARWRMTNSRSSSRRRPHDADDETGVVDIHASEPHAHSDSALALSEAQLDATVYMALSDVTQRLRHGATNVRETVLCEHGALPVSATHIHIPTRSSSVHNVQQSDAIRYTAPEWVRLYWITRLTTLCNEFLGSSSRTTTSSLSSSAARPSSRATEPASEHASCVATHNHAKVCARPAFLNESCVAELLLPRAPVSTVRLCPVCAERQHRERATRRRLHTRCAEELQCLPTLTMAAASASCSPVSTVQATHNRNKLHATAATATLSSTSTSACTAAVSTSSALIAPEKHVNVTHYFAVEDSAAVYAEALRVWREEQDVKVFQRRSYVEQLDHIVRRQQQQQQQQQQQRGRIRGRGGGGSAHSRLRGSVAGAGVPSSWDGASTGGEKTEDSPAGRLARAQNELQCLITEPAPMLERRWGCVPSRWVRHWYDAVRRVQTQNAMSDEGTCVNDNNSVRDGKEQKCRKKDDDSDHADVCTEDVVDTTEQAVPAVPGLPGLSYDEFICSHGGSLLELSWLDPTSAFWRSGHAKHAALLWKRAGDRAADPCGDHSAEAKHEPCDEYSEDSNTRNRQKNSHENSNIHHGTRKGIAPFSTHTDGQNTTLDDRRPNDEGDEDENSVCDWMPPLVLVPMPEFVKLLQRYGPDLHARLAHQEGIRVPMVVERFGVRALAPPPCSVCIQDRLALARRWRDRFDEGTVVVQLHLRRSKKQFYDATGVIGERAGGGGGAAGAAAAAAAAGESGKAAEDVVSHDMTLAALRDAITRHIARAHRWLVPANELQITRARGKPLRRRGATDSVKDAHTRTGGMESNTNESTARSLEDATLYELDIHDGDTLEVNLWETKVQPCGNHTLSVSSAATAPLAAPVSATEAGATRVEEEEEVWQEIPAELLLPREEQTTNTLCEEACAGAGRPTFASTIMLANARTCKGAKKKRHATNVAFSTTSRLPPLTGEGVGETEGVSCPVCTYLNARDMVICEMCESVLPEPAC